MANTAYVSEKQTRPFVEEATRVVDGVDLSYEGYSTDTPSLPFVLSKNDAVVNKVLLWLASSRGDYVREPLKGGPLINLLGKGFTEENAQQIKIDLSDEFLLMFSDELTLLNVNVEADKINRKWIVTMYIKDKIRKELFSTAIAVEGS